MKTIKHVGIPLLLTGVLLSLTPAYGANPLPAVRTPGGRGSWNGLVGVPGGITNRPVYTTINPSGADQTSQIQNAINNCPSGSAVVLGAGTFNVSGIYMYKSGVTLKGAGKGLTLLNTSGSPSVQIGNWQWWNNETIVNPSSGNHVNWTGGLAQGSTSITIADTTGYSVGQIIVTDQLNDSDTQPGGNSSNGNYQGYGYTSIAYPTDGRDRFQFQLNRIVAINGTTITLSEPIYMPNWNAAQNPQTWRFANSPVIYSGLEDLEVSSTLQMHVAYACWFKNVRAHGGTQTANGFIKPHWSLRCQIEGCDYDASQTGLDTYGIETRACAGLLVQHNSSRMVGVPLNPSGCSGSVWAYNVMTNIHPFYSVILQGLLQHGGNPTMNLYEGNYSPAIGLDNTWGSSAYNTAFRSRAVGYDETVGAGYGNQAAFAANVTNRHSCSIGNVLGTKGINTWYEDYPGSPNGCHNGGSIYYFGYYDVGCNATYSDTGARSTCIRAYNWTSATTTNNGIAADGYTSADLPQSYYLTSKPAFFGTLPWPPIDPGNPTYSSSYTNIPAGYRDVFGMDPPSGPANQPPVAVVSASTNSAATNQVINFSSTGSFDPEGVSLSYTWNFGDGSTSTAANPSHAFATSGVFSVSLSVSDGVNTTSASMTVTIHLVGVNLPPTASATASVTGGVAPLTVAFSSAGSVDPEGAALTYIWNFGDGTTSTAANPSKTYSTVGIYSANLTVSDGTNSVSATPISISVGNGASGLVAAYGFEEGSGSNVSDTSGMNNAGTLSGATWTPSGKFGNGLSFSSSSLVTVADSASLHLTTSLTLEAWVYPKSFSGSWMNLIIKPNGDPGSASPCYLAQGATPPSSVPSVFTSISSSNLTASSSLPLNTWSHIATTYDGATMSLYINGVLVGTETQTGSLATSTDALTIGGNAYSGQNWNGMIDEVRIYNRALSSTEIMSDMNTPIVGNLAKPSPPTGLHVAGP